ncbi:MAG: polysaccharide deacetylase family protein [Christensenellales bacterium]
MHDSHKRIGSKNKSKHVYQTRFSFSKTKYPRLHRHSWRGLFQGLLIFILLAAIGSAVYLILPVFQPRKTGIIPPDSKNTEGIAVESMMDWTDTYQISVTYPSVEASTIISKKILDFCNERINFFHAEMKANSGSSGQEYTMFFEPYNVGNKYLSILFDESYSVSNSSVHTKFCLVYDLKLEAAVSLGELFVDDSNYLDKLSVICREKLKEDNPKVEFQQASFENGTAPTLQNYSNFLLKQGELVILFTGNKIAVSKEGAFIVSIPLEELKSILKVDVISNAGTVLPSIAPSPSAAVKTAANTPQPSPFSVSQLTSEDFPPLLPNAKVVALTFDNGPHVKNTPRIVKALQANGAVATFFISGERVEYAEAAIKQAYEAGNEIGCNGYRLQSFQSQSPSVVLDQLALSLKKIRIAGGITPYLLRPPFGLIDEQLAGQTNMQIIRWNLDAKDYQSMDARTVVETVMSNITDGSIILLHDSFESTALAVEILLPRLKQEGYSCITVSHLLYLMQQKGRTVSNIYP